MMVGCCAEAYMLHPNRTRRILRVRPSLELNDRRAARPPHDERPLNIRHFHAPVEHPAPFDGQHFLRLERPNGLQHETVRGTIFHKRHEHPVAVRGRDRKRPRHKVVTPLEVRISLLRHHSDISFIWFDRKNTKPISREMGFVLISKFF